MGNLIRELRLKGLHVHTAVSLQEVAKEVHNPIMDNDDPAGGVTTHPCTMQVKDFRGDPIDYKIRLKLKCNQDSGGAMVPLFHGVATIVAADVSVGTILGGAGTNSVDIETDATGRFDFKLNNTAMDTVWLVPVKTDGSPVIDETGIDSVTFS